MSFFPLITQCSWCLGRVLSGAPILLHLRKGSFFLVFITVYWPPQTPQLHLIPLMMLHVVDASCVYFHILWYNTCQIMQVLMHYYIIIILISNCTIPIHGRTLGWQIAGKHEAGLAWALQCLGVTYYCMYLFVTEVVFLLGHQKQ